MKRLLSITLILMMIFVMLPTIANAKKGTISTTGSKTSSADTNSDGNSVIASIKFDNNLRDDANQENLKANGNYSYVDGVLPGTKALHLESGDDNYVGTRHSLKFGKNSFTISFWYKGDTNKNQVILSNKDFSKGSNAGWAIYTSDNSIHMNLGFPTSKEKDISFGRDTFDASDWRYVTFVVNRDRMLAKLYVDGFKMTEATLRHGSLDTSAPLNIGSDGLGNHGGNSLDIADLKIWKGVLSSDEVQDRYKGYDVNNVNLKALSNTISKADQIITSGLGDGFNKTDFDYLHKVLKMAKKVETKQKEKLYPQETINYYKRELTNAIFIYQKSNKTETPADLNMIVNSDPEINDNPTEIARVKEGFKKSLKTFPQADVMLIPGDVTGGNHPNEYLFMNDLTNVYNKLKDQGLFDNIRLYLARGNHDMAGAENLIPEGTAGVWNESTNSYENQFYNGAYRVKVNGYNLVVFDGNNANKHTSGKVKKLLDEIQNEPDYDPTKPIFVSSHYPVEGTVWGSNWSSEASNKVGKYIAENHLSQVVYIAGHTHYDPTDPRSLYQGEATYVEAGSMNYSSYIDDGPYGGYIEGDYINYNTKPGISNFIEIYGKKMIIKRYNVNTDKFVGTPSVVNVGKGKDAFTYSRDDTKELIAPQFDKDMKINTVKGNKVGFTIKQADDNVRVLEYNVQVINQLTGEVEKSFNSLSLPMDKPYDKYKKYKITGLLPKTPYKIRVFADDAMYNRSSQDIEITTDGINVSGMKKVVERFKEEEEITNDQAAHALNIHLTAVDHYVENKSADKIVRHMKGFKLLLEHQKNNELISMKVYNVLKADADYVIQKWK